MFKDEWISKRHRLWGFNVPVVDIDYLSVQNNKVIEFKQERGLSLIQKKINENKGAGTNYTATQEFCDNSYLEYYIGVYNNNSITIYPSNDLAKSRNKRNFTIPKIELENWIEGSYRPKDIIVGIDMLAAINKTYKPRNTSRKFEYKVSPERTFWRDKELDSLTTNDVNSFLGLEYDKGSPTMLVEYIDVTEDSNNIVDRDVNIYDLNIPIIYFKYNSEEALEKNRIKIELSYGNKKGKELLEKNNFTLENGKVDTIESTWIKFLYSARGYTISDDYLNKIKQSADKMKIKKLNHQDLKL